MTKYQFQLPPLLFSTPEMADLPVARFRDGELVNYDHIMVNAPYTRFPESNNYDKQHYMAEDWRRETLFYVKKNDAMPLDGDVLYYGVLKMVEILCHRPDNPCPPRVYMTWNIMKTRYALVKKCNRHSGNNDGDDDKYLRIAQGTT